MRRRLATSRTLSYSTNVKIMLMHLATATIVKSADLKMKKVLKVTN